MKADDELRFSLCTCFQGRINSLHETAADLRAQTDQGFEWIIVGDQGVDGFQETVGTLRAKAAFPIYLIDEKCRGGHIAVNKAVGKARGLFFILLPDDARLVTGALECMWYHWNTIPSEERSYYVAVSGVADNQDGSPAGNRFPSSPFDSNNIEVSTYYGVASPKYGCILTTVLQTYPFPVFDGESFVPFELILNRIGNTALTRYVNETFAVMSPDDAGTSGNEKLRWIQNPRASALYYNEFTGYRIPLVHRIRACLQYIRFSMHAGVIPDEIYRQAKRKIITFFMLWPGLFLYRRDKRSVGVAVREEE